MLHPGLYNYWIVIILMMTGLYMVIARGNLVKKLIGLNIFQVSVFMLYISMGKLHNGTAPILKMQKVPISAMHHKGKPTVSCQKGKWVLNKSKPTAHQPHATGHHVKKLPQFRGVVYSNPVPHVLILTAIVVGIATTALGLALVVRIYEAYGTIEEDEILLQDDES
jgi:multicomponent Na+:H+ antiporter subunit C